MSDASKSNGPVEVGPWSSRVPASLPAAPLPESSRASVIGAGGARRYLFKELIARNWRGEYPLWVSFWVIGLAGNLAALLLMIILPGTNPIGLEKNPVIVLALLFAMWLATALLAIWQLVGIRRSAERRRKELRHNGKIALWPTLAKAAGIVAIFGADGVFLSDDLASIWEAWNSYVLDDPDISPYSLRVMRNGTELEITGGIKNGLNDDLIRLLDANPKVRVIHLDSPGGLVWEAEKIYATIKDRGLITYVARACFSACPIVFAGGTQRWAKENARLGFHGPQIRAFAEAGIEDRVELQRALLIAAGVTADFAQKALSIPNSEIWVPGIAELQRAHLVTHVSLGDDFAASGYGGNPTRDKIATMLEKTYPSLTALKEVSANEFDAIVEDFSSGYREGQTEDALTGAAREHLDAIIHADIPLADDATMIEVGELLLAQYQAFQKMDAKTCYQAAGGDGKEVFGELPSELREREEALGAHILRTAAKRPEPNPAFLNELRAQVSASLDKRIGVKPEQYADVCEAEIAFIQEVLSLKEADAALLLRYRFH
jgi:hypothetical protein